MTSWATTEGIMVWGFDDPQREPSQANSHNPCGELDFKMPSDFSAMRAH